MVKGSLSSSKEIHLHLFCCCPDLRKILEKLYCIERIVDAIVVGMMTSLETPLCTVSDNLLCLHFRCI